MAAAHTASSLRASSSLGSGIRTPSSVLLDRRPSGSRTPSQAQIAQPRPTDDHDDDDEEQSTARREEAEATHLSQSSSPVWPILQMIRSDINTTIDTGLSWEELTGHELNFAVVRPLAVKYSKLKSPAILYAMLLTRIHFIREADRDLAYQNINQTRSDLCEILAIKLLRTFAADGSELVVALSTPFWPLAGSSDQVLDLAQRRGYDCEHFPNQQSSSTLQLAIYSQAKKFIATPLVQKCVDGIWNGQIVLGNSSAGRGAIIEDSYKRRPVSFYDPRTAPFLDYHRLRVPRIRSFLEVANFAFILTFYVLCLASKGSQTWTAAETLYTIWLTGLALDELAQFQEHTPSVYFGSLFNVLDALFCINGFCWLGIRISALVTHSPARSDFSFDVLALGAILLCPRLASLLISDNVLMLALRAMVVEFGYFFGLALVFFSGFLWTFWSLADSPKWTPTRISWLMLRFTFGNTISFEEAQQFSTTFGPILVVAFTILSQTLLLTILISLLSATFARVAAHAQEESLFQHSFATLQGASSEALFSYFPPLNIICLLTILPASFTLTPRWVHKLNVFVIRTTHLPILLAIRVVQQLQWGRTIELASEKSTTVFGRWRWGSKRGHPDLIEIVFGDLADKHGSESELAKRFPAAKPLSSTYAHQAVVHHHQPGESESSETQKSKRHPPVHTDVDRVQWADETYDLPDSPGTTLRKAKAAAAGNTSAWSSLARRDTFAQLPRGGHSEDDGHEQQQARASGGDDRATSTAGGDAKGADADANATGDGEDRGDDDDDDDPSAVLLPIELVDEGPTAGATSVPKRRKRSGSKSSKSSHTSHKGLRKGGASSLSPLTRVLTSSRQALSSPSSSKVPAKRAHTISEGGGDSVDVSEKDTSATMPAVAPDPPTPTASTSPFSAYRLYRSSRSALLGKRRALSEDDVTMSSPPALIVSGHGDDDAEADEEAGTKRQVRVLPTPARAQSADLNMAATATSSTTNTAGLTSLSRILNRKDTFDAGDTTDVDTALEQQTNLSGGGSGSADAVGAIRDVMLSFLERLDDQAESVQRIESLLAGVLRERRGQVQDGAGEEKQQEGERGHEQEKRGDK